MKITVIGGSGFIGSHVVELLIKNKFKVKVLDKKKSNLSKLNYKFVPINILNKKKLSKVLKGTDIVFNFAALSDLEAAKNSILSTVKINIEGVVNILAACKKNKVRRLIHASSIYAASKQGNFYGISKRAGEDYIEKFSKLYNLDYTILRFGTLYGTRSDLSNGLNKIINIAIKKKYIVYSGSNRAYRKYIRVNEAAEICVASINEKFKNKCLNITGQKLIKVLNLMKLVSKFYNIPLTKIKFLNKKESGHYDKNPIMYKPLKAINIKSKKTNFNHNLNQYLKNYKIK